MFVRKNSAKLAAAGLAAGAVAFAALAPAGAATGLKTTLNQGASVTAKPVANSDAAKGTVVFAGSDTIQYVVADLADAWNTNHAAEKINGKTYTIASFNALADDGGVAPQIAGNWNGIDGTDAAANIKTPNGSGGGLTLLGSPDAAGGSVISYARSSSAPDDGGSLFSGKSSDGTGFPFALDTVVLAVSANNHSAPQSINDAQVLSIYNGSAKNWKDVGGADAPLDAYVPKSGSGTAKFFGGQIDNISVGLGGSTVSSGANKDLTNAKNKYTPAGGTETDVSEHSGAPLAADVNGVVPISLGRAYLWNATHSNAADKIRVLGGFKEQRALWIFARTDKAGDSARGQGNVNPDVYSGGAVTTRLLSGSNSFFCSAEAQEIIKADGFYPLSPAFCGVSKVSKGDIVPASNGGADHIATQDMYIANPLLADVAPGGGSTQTPPAHTGDSAALKAAKATLAKDKKALTAAKKALKKAKGHKKVVLKKKVAKLTKAVKADQKKVSSLS